MMTILDARGKRAREVMCAVPVRRVRLAGVVERREICDLRFAMCDVRCAMCGRSGQIQPASLASQPATRERDSAVSSSWAGGGAFFFFFTRRRHVGLPQSIHLRAPSSKEICVRITQGDGQVRCDRIVGNRNSQAGQGKATPGPGTAPSCSLSPGERERERTTSACSGRDIASTNTARHEREHACTHSRV
jgi:hypothetical protein